MSQLSRRSLVATAATLPALVVPAGAAATASVCTLRPDLIERFIKVRAWYVDAEPRAKTQWEEVKKRFRQASGGQDLLDTKQSGRRSRELRQLHDQIYLEVVGHYPEDEEDIVAEHGDERWAVAALVTAVALASVSGSFGIVGMTAIFAAAVAPIMVMTGVLEAAKLVTAAWLARHWRALRHALPDLRGARLPAWRPAGVPGRRRGRARSPRQAGGGVSIRIYIRSP